MPNHLLAQVSHAQKYPVATNLPLPWRDEFWRRVSVYKDVSAESFLSYQWSVSLSRNRHQRKFICYKTDPRSGLTDHAVVQVEQIKNTTPAQGKHKLFGFLSAVVPDEVPYDKNGTKAQRSEEFLGDGLDGVGAAIMAVRVTFVSTPFLSFPSTLSLMRTE